jgi:hypothetical protein
MHNAVSLSDLQEGFLVIKINWSVSKGPLTTLASLMLEARLESHFIERNKYIIDLLSIP